MTKAQQLSVAEVNLTNLNIAAFQLWLVYRVAYSGCYLTAEPIKCNCCNTKMHSIFTPSHDGDEAKKVIWRLPFQEESQSRSTSLWCCQRRSIDQGLSSQLPHVSRQTDWQRQWIWFLKIVPSSFLSSAIESSSAPNFSPFLLIPARQDFEKGINSAHEHHQIIGMAPAALQPPGATRLAMCTHSLFCVVKTATFERSTVVFSLLASQRKSNLVVGGRLSKSAFTPRTWQHGCSFVCHVLASQEVNDLIF